MSDNFLRRNDRMHNMQAFEFANADRCTPNMRHLIILPCRRLLLQVSQLRRWTHSDVPAYWIAHGARRSSRATARAFVDVDSDTIIDVLPSETIRKLQKRHPQSLCTS